ncbi:LytR/AlgR family response regulator transcription factor [Flavobacterium soli]|uniref:LytR/AlgR family response regulator transcription factor n=1 Tax=Flavobacterium soli TaxID=344881 RepID=UPI0003FE986D|nr:LytTR family transcriptional regulator DNA-binding domain-containing protein [Flavobacterium soli]
MQFSFILVDNDDSYMKETLELLENFPDYFCVGHFKDNEMAIKQIIKLKPQLVLMRIGNKFNNNVLSFQTIAELFQYVHPIPYFIALASSPEFALDAIQSGFSDYLMGPLSVHQLGKSFFKFEKRAPEKKSTVICIKSYSDYQFVNLEEIVYLKADNNTTDIQLINGKVVNAYKTLKHFENALPFYFLRIHKSYIVNVNHVSRIHFSKSKCYMNYKEVLPFSITYRENIEVIIRKIDI